MVNQIPSPSQLTPFSYRCLFPEPSSMECSRSCASAGVLGPVPGLVGCLQANEVIKWIVSSELKSYPNLIRKQIYFDAYSSEPYLYELPPKDPACLSCGKEKSILSMEDTQNFLNKCLTKMNALSQLPSIPNENRISVTEYASISSPHILLDVRSQAQFSMGAIQCPNIVNIPYKDITQETTHDMIIQYQTTQSESASVPIYVICKRGNDSVRATRKLLDFGITKVTNIDGGLEAWREGVDPSFPSF